MQISCLAVLLAATGSALAPTPGARPMRRLGRTAATVPTGGEIVKVESGGGGEAPLAVSAACAGVVLFGYHLGVVNAPLDAMAATLGFGEAAAGAVVSSTLVGATGGALLGGAAADHWGRRGAMLRNSALLAAAAAGCASATTVPQLLAARFAAGVAIGVASAVSPLYISEVSPTAKRGTYGAFNQAAICLGILLSIATGLGVTPASPASRWRPMFSAALVPTALHFLLAWKAPESPRWPGNADAAADARRLWGAAAADELGAGEGAVATGSWGQMFSGAHRGDAATAFLLFMIQQFAGINAIVYFSTKVFRDAGLKSAVLGSVAVATTNILGTVGASGLVDKFGRKAMLFTSYAGMAAAMGVMGACLAAPALAGTSTLAAVSFFGTMAYILAFAIGCGPVPGLLVPELFPTALRAKGGSVAMFSHWFCNTIVGATFLPLVSKFGIPKVYGFFAAVAAVGALHAKFGLKETSGAALA